MERLKILFFIVLVFLAGAGCMYQRPMLISQPPGSETIFIPQQPGIKVIKPDITRIYIQNSSRILNITGIWFDTKDGLPAIKLSPESGQFVNLFPGKHPLIAEGEIYAGPYGKITIGQMTMVIYVGAVGRQYSISENDFPEFRKMLNGGYSIYGPPAGYGSGYIGPVPQAPHLHPVGPPRYPRGYSPPPEHPRDNPPRYPRGDPRR